MSAANLFKVRKLLTSIHTLAEHLTEKEISDIGKILLRAINRLETEAIDKRKSKKNSARKSSKVKKGLGSS